LTRFLFFLTNSKVAIFSPLHSVHIWDNAQQRQAHDFFNVLWLLHPIIQDFYSDDNQLDLFSQVKEESRAFGPSPQENFEQDYDLEVNWSQQVFDQVKHVFSHRKWHIQILAGQVTETKQFSDREIRWVSPQEFSDYPLAKPQQKIWQAYKTALEDKGLQ